MAKGIHKFRIMYKSGQSIEVTADDLTVSYNNYTGSITELKWNNLSPKPMFPGLNDIESVWQVR